MSAFAEFHFLRPLWFLALLPLLVLLWLMVKSRLASRSWELVCDAALLPYILTGTSVRQRRLSIILTGIGGLLAILALAGPVWEKLPQPVFTRSSALVLALDLSRSMDAADISPSRLLRARFKIADILQRRTDGLTALLVYAGDSFIVTPLTDDSATITSQLQALTTEIMPVPGNNTLLALQQAEQLLKQAGAANGDILLITDEIDYEQAGDFAADLHDQGYQVSVLAVGTEQGVPIPQADGSFLKDSSGGIVVPALLEEPMRRLAATGGGIYQRLTPADEDTNGLLEFFAGHEQEGEIEATELQTDTWREQGPWLLLLVLPLLAAMFRRGYLVVLVLFLLPVPKPAQAMDWDTLWSRPDQRAQRAFDAGDTESAAKLFQDPAWKGSAQYKSGDFEGAVATLEQLQDKETLYNKGNALARQGNYQEAIASYDQVLQQDPEHADARFNKDLVEKELQQQQQQNQQQQQQAGQNQQDQQQQQQQSEQQQGQDQDQPDTGEQQSDSDPRQADQQQSQQQQQVEQEQQQQLNDAQPGDDKAGDDDRQSQLAQSDQPPPDEDQQATEQWLRRIPDDPAGLLRRKFLYQYQQRDSNSQSTDKTW